jgi:hypothetical protein
MSTALDEDLFTVLDWDFEVPCTIKAVVCDRAAEWRTISKCCGKVSLFCSPHMQEKHNLISTSSTLNQAWAPCNVCGSQKPPGNPYSLIERLDKSR